ncbi:bZIP transcription factor [Fusarium oxysporum f. sp. phaseoli]
MMGEGGSMAVDSIRIKLGVDTFNTLPIAPNPFWEQWLMDRRAFPQSAEGGILASVYRQSECLFNDSMPTSPTSPLDHWNDPYSASTLTTTPSVFQTPFPKTPHQLGIPPPPLTAKKEERQKRKRCLNKNSTRKSLRRDSSRDSKANTARGGGGTGCSNRPRGTHGHHGSEHSDQQGKSHSQHAKERNRIAAGKSRAKKREHTLRVQSEEQELERTNHDLSNCVANLTREVQELKMKLLQHTDCDCSHIHDYLAAETQRYICGLSKQSQLEAIPPGAACN